MAVTLANGSIVQIATKLVAEKKVTAVSNEAEAVCTATAHGLQNGDYVALLSGWGVLNERVFRVTSVDANSFKLDGIDTRDLNKFPAGSGAGSFQKVEAWQQVTQIMEVSSSGGEQQFVDFGFLEDDFERKLPTTQSAYSMTFKIADDPNLPGYKAAQTASDSGKLTPMRIILKNKSVVVYNGYVSMSPMPQLVRNEVMAVNMTYSLSGLFNRYL